MKKVIIAFLGILILLNLTVLAKPKIIQEFKVSNSQVVLNSAKTSLKKFYKESYTGQDDPLKATDFNNPYMISVYAKDESNKSKPVVAVAFPNRETKDSWDYVIYEYKDNKIKGVLKQGGTLSSNIQETLFNEAKNAFKSEMY